MVRNSIILIFSCLVIFSCSNQRQGQIAIQPFGAFDPALTDTIKNTLESIYKTKVLTYPSKPIPKSAFVNVKTPRYRADSLIRILKRNKPDSIDCIIGLTNKDISTTKRNEIGLVKQPESKYSDWGVFGLGYRPGASSVVSTFRIKNKISDRFIERLKKICTHEIGHNLGLKHCSNSENCVMRDAAETIKTVDFVDLTLCKMCRSKLN